MSIVNLSFRHFSFAGQILSPFFFEFSSDFCDRCNLNFLCNTYFDSTADTSGIRTWSPAIKVFIIGVKCFRTMSSTWNLPMDLDKTDINSSHVWHVQLVCLAFDLLALISWVFSVKSHYHLHLCNPFSQSYSPINQTPLKYLRIIIELYVELRFDFSPKNFWFICILDIM